MGKTWQDMPGEGHENKKLNFSLFRRGHLSLEDVEGDSVARGKRHFMASVKALAARRKASWQAWRAGELADQSFSMAPKGAAEQPPPTTEASIMGRRPSSITERQTALQARFAAIPKFRGKVVALAGAANVSRATVYWFSDGHHAMDAATLDALEAGLAQVERQHGIKGANGARAGVIEHGDPAFRPVTLAPQRLIDLQNVTLADVARIFNEVRALRDEVLDLRREVGELHAGRARS